MAAKVTSSVSRGVVARGGRDAPGSSAAARASRPSRPLRRTGSYAAISNASSVKAWPRASTAAREQQRRALAACQAAKNGAGKSNYDYDVCIIGCGVGGHGAALHAVQQGLKTCIIEGHDIGGTCVNRGCVPSKALLAASGRIREMQNEMHLKAMGIQVGSVSFDRQGVADHANQLASNIQGNLKNSLVALGVDIHTGMGKFVDNHTIEYGLPGRVDVGGSLTARDIIIATGSVPFVPPGIKIDGKTVFTSDHALKLEWIPDWVAIIGSGYIGLEFSDVYTALGSEVTFIEAVDKIMPGFDNEIARLAQRTLITPRNIDFRTGVLATSVKAGVPGVKPVEIELTDFKTKEKVDVMEVDACLVATGRVPFTQGLGLDRIGAETDRRGFVPVSDKMEVLGKNGKPVPNVYCIGDANGKYMLAHAASAQGISAIENIVGRSHVLNHLSVPAACFTHPEVAFVGLTEEQARERAEEEKFEIGVAKTSFKANSKALAELEGDGMAKAIYRKDTGEILGVWIIGLHAADLIHEASNAVANGMSIAELKFCVHAHPTLSEVLDELFKHAEVDRPAEVKPKTVAKTVATKA